jgi:hypothetical protein
MAILLKDVAALLVKGILISCERAATTFVKRYGYSNQRCGCPS